MVGRIWTRNPQWGEVDGEYLLLPWDLLGFCSWFHTTLTTSTQTFALCYMWDKREICLQYFQGAAICRLGQLCIDSSHDMSLPKILMSWETQDISKRWEKRWKRAGVRRWRPLSFLQGQLHYVALEIRSTGQVWEIIGFLTSGKIADTDT